MRHWVLLVIMLTGRWAGADELADRQTVAGITEFTAADVAWDNDRFAAAVESFRQATTNPAPTVTNYYWLGTALFHRMLHFQHAPANSTNASAAEAAGNAAVEALSKAVKLDPHHAESQALLGTLYGMKIEGKLLRAAWYGPRVDKHRKAAIAFGAENPRVHYLLGTCQFHTATKPAALREALATLLKARKLFEAEDKITPGPLEPRWGYASCLTYIGRVYESLGQPQEAAESFRRALVEHPADRLAAEGLKRVTERR